MNLLCPDCCSEEAELVDGGEQCKCGNCGASFTREQALVTVVDAEAHAEQRAESVRDAERSACPPAGQLPLTDSEALDELAEKLNEGDWNGGDVCELAAHLIRCTGRPIAGEEGVSPCE